jgi:hypothetical protein
MKPDPDLTLDQLAPLLDRFWEISGRKIRLIDERYDASRGSPVFTVEGAYTTRGWTEWTQGFQYGSAFLQFDATDDPWFLDYARRETLLKMAPHLSHIGVHDHGFNNVSTYGNWLRLIREGRVPDEGGWAAFCELALKVSGAVQAARWTETAGGGGYIYSFNGPHSLFVDTIRSCRALMVSHALGHALMADHDERISLLERALKHIEATARHAVYYGEGRDGYDEWGRVAHESIFNTNDGRYRCPNAQQGFSGFTTWTRGLAWAMVGFAEELEFLATLDDAGLEPLGGREKWEGLMRKAARATCDWFLANAAADGIPYWDGGAPGLVHLSEYRERPADPFNDHEPVDSSAAAIGAQGLLRLGRHLGVESDDGRTYWQAGLTSLRTLLGDTYLSLDEDHQGLCLHSVYHRPNGWDHVPEGRRVPCGESSMWGDYHIRELALFAGRHAADRDYTFFGCVA